MKRWLVRIIVCLLLGAVTTVAVAWGLAWLAPDFTGLRAPKRAFTRDVRDYQGEWLVERAEEFGVFIVVSRRRVRAEMEPATHSRAEVESLVPAWSGLAETSAEFLRQDPGFEEIWVEAAGWPMHATYYVVESRGPYSNWPGTRTERGAIRFRTDNYTNYRIGLPCLPIWPGFGIDTLFYAAIWGGVFFGFASAKRGVRRRRGRCPMCGYDLRGNLDHGCPECGWRRTGGE